MLSATFRIDETEIGELSVRRLTKPTGGGVLPEPDEVHEYKVVLETDGGATKAYVKHRYGDGAPALLAKAFDEVNKNGVPFRNDRV